MKIWRDILYGPSNTHYDVGRVSLAASIFATIAFQGWAIHNGQTFDPIAFSGGLGALIGAAGLGIAAKDKARPQALLEGECIAD